MAAAKEPCLNVGSSCTIGSSSLPTCSVWGHRTAHRGTCSTVGHTMMVSYNDGVNVTQTVGVTAQTKGELNTSTHTRTHWPTQCSHVAEHNHTALHTVLPLTAHWHSLTHTPSLTHLLCGAAVLPCQSRPSAGSRWPACWPSGHLQGHVVRHMIAVAAGLSQSVQACVHMIGVCMQACLYTPAYASSSPVRPGVRGLGVSYILPCCALLCCSMLPVVLPASSAAAVRYLTHQQASPRERLMTVSRCAS
jgi:hypothetical protein